MTQAFYTGVSGLKTNQYAIDTVSDNLANISTTGFRSSTTEFSSLFEKTLSTTYDNTANTVGVGSAVQGTTLSQAQGSLMLSDRTTDLAIMGEGWFGVQRNDNTMYTRDGGFGFDSNSDLVTDDGLHVLGTMGGNINGGVLSAQLDETIMGAVTAQGPLNFPNILTYPTEPSTKAEFKGNIGSDDETRSMSAGVVDSLGSKNNLKLTFTKTVPQTLPGSQWDIVATTQTLDGETIYDTKNAQISFNSSGALISTTLTSIDNNGSAIAIDLGSGFDGVVSLGGEITSSSVSDGAIAGDLVGYNINNSGEVIAAFSNGMQSSVGKIALFHFQNDQGLQRVGNSNFTQSNNSGDAIFYTDINGAYTSGSEIASSRLESSNVNMAKGLTELIIYQRSFDASSKSITTADEMMQKALNMDA